MTDDLAKFQEQLRYMDRPTFRMAAANLPGAHMSKAGKVLVRKAEGGRMAVHCVLLHDFTGGDTEDEVWEDVDVILVPRKRWRARKGAPNNTHGFKTGTIMQFIGDIPDDELCDFDEVT